MAIKDILKMYAGTGSSTTEDGRMLALSLAEIQSELERLRDSLGAAPIPTEVHTTFDTSALEAAISQLKPLPPQNLDLNPVYRSYEQTAQAIKELLGEVKTTNHRLIGYAGGGGGPSSVGIRDEASGNKLAIDANGAIAVTGSSGGGGGLTDTQLRASPVATSISNFPAVQPVSDNGGSLTVDGSISVSNFPATQPVSGSVTVISAPTTAVTGPLTDTQLRATPVPVSGTISTGLTQPLTDTQLRASAVPISDNGGSITVDGTFWQATQPVSISGTVTTTGPLTDTQLRATAVPVSGPVTDAQLRATPVPVSNTTQLPASLGQKTMAASLPMVFASDQTALPISISAIPTFTRKATYAAAVAGLVTAASATDIFVITGSASKTVTVTKFYVDGIQTTAGAVNFLLIKRSADNSGGTSAAATRIPYDSNDAAATAVVRSYTANPTSLGAAVGTIRADRIFIPAAATAVDAQGQHWMFGDDPTRGVILRGAAQVLALNLNSVTITGPAINISVEWTEE